MRLVKGLISLLIIVACCTGCGLSDDDFREAAIVHETNKLIGVDVDVLDAQIISKRKGLDSKYHLLVQYTVRYNFDQDDAEIKKGDVRKYTIATIFMEEDGELLNSIGESFETEKAWYMKQRQPEKGGS